MIPAGAKINCADHAHIFGELIDHPTRYVLPMAASLCLGSDTRPECPSRRLCWADNAGEEWLGTVKLYVQRRVAG